MTYTFWKLWAGNFFSQGSENRGRWKREILRSWWGIYLFLTIWWPICYIINIVLQILVHWNEREIKNIDITLFHFFSRKNPFQFRSNNLIQWDFQIILTWFRRRSWSWTAFGTFWRVFAWFHLPKQKVLNWKRETKKCDNYSLYH